MTKTEQIKTFLRERGFDLRELKGKNIQSDIVSKALNTQEALEALDLYYELKVPILGGDVFYLNKNKEIDWTLDNCYFQKEEESNVEFLKRSIDGSVKYINNYNNIHFRNCTFLFDIVYEKPGE